MFLSFQTSTVNTSLMKQISKSYYSIPVVGLLLITHLHVAIFSFPLIFFGCCRKREKEGWNWVFLSFVGLWSTKCFEQMLCQYSWERGLKSARLSEFLFKHFSNLDILQLTKNSIAIPNLSIISGYLWCLPQPNFKAYCNTVIVHHRKTTISSS